MRLNKKYIGALILILALLLIAGAIMWFGGLFSLVQPQKPNPPAAQPPPLSPDLSAKASASVEASAEEGPAPAPIAQAYPAGYDVFKDNNPAFSADRKASYRAMFDEVVRRIKSDGANVTHWTDLGSIKYGLMDYKGAEAAWSYAVQIDPFSTLAYTNLAQLYWRDLPNYPKAEAMFRKLIDADITGGMWYAYRDLSDFYRSSYKEKAHLADDVLREGINRYPGNESLLIALARLYLQTGDDKQAIEYYTKILEISPNNESAKEALTQLKEKQG